MLLVIVRKVLLAAALLLPLSIAAVVLEPLSVKSLAREAEIVLHGKVLSKTCLRDNAGRIYTRVELQVIEVWKGAISGSPFLIVHGGGVLGEEQSVVSAQVQYDPTEEVVAFLVRNERGEGVTLGLMQGKFRVWKDAATGTKYAVSPVHGAPEKLRDGFAGLSAGASMLRPAPLELGQLKQQVQEGVR